MNRRSFLGFAALGSAAAAAPVIAGASVLAKPDPTETKRAIIGGSVEIRDAVIHGGIEIRNSTHVVIQNCIIHPEPPARGVVTRRFTLNNGL